MPSVRGHHHLAIQVKDLAGAVRFYGDVLGLKVVRRWPHEDGRPGERSGWVSAGQGEEFIALEACDRGRLSTPFREPHGRPDLPRLGGPPPGPHARGRRLSGR